MRSTGVEHRMVWDPSGESWRHFGFRVQPASVVVAPDGSVLASFPRSLELDEALAAATR